MSDLVRSIAIWIAVVSMIAMYSIWLLKCQPQCRARQDNLVIRSPTEASDWSPDTNV